MNSDPAHEPPIDTSLTHHLESRALAIALAKATGAQERGSIGELAALRDRLMQRREAFHAEATAKRHARGEIYSKARVAAINAMGGDRAELDELARASYASQANARDVLKQHARSHFGLGLVSQRLLLASHTPDIIAAARALQDDEEAFARAWIATIGDDAFAAELRRLQRETVVMLRTSTRPMHLVTDATDACADDDAVTLGKAWSRLDTLAQELGVEPLSDFIAFEEEGQAGSVPARRVLASVEALIAAIGQPGGRFPGKRGILDALGRARAVLLACEARGGQVRFDIDL